MNQYISAKRAIDSSITITTKSQSGILLEKNAIPACPIRTDTTTEGMALVDTVSIYFP